MSNCPAVGCEVPNRPGMFMCKMHWFKVPKRIRNQIWAEARANRILGKQYCEAAVKAILAVADVEGKPVPADAEGLNLYNRLLARAERHE